MYSEFTIARDIYKAVIPDYRRIWIGYILYVVAHSNRPNSLPVFRLCGFLILGARNADQRSVGYNYLKGGWRVEMAFLFSQVTGDRTGK